MIFWSVEGWVSGVVGWCSGGGWRETYGVGNYGFLGVHGGGGCEEGGEGCAGDEGGGLGGSVGLVSAGYQGSIGGSN